MNTADHTFDDELFCVAVDGEGDSIGFIHLMVSIIIPKSIRSDLLGQPVAGGIISNIKAPRHDQAMGVPWCITCNNNVWIRVEVIVVGVFSGKEYH